MFLAGSVRVNENCAFDETVENACNWAAEVDVAEEKAVQEQGEERKIEELGFGGGGTDFVEDKRRNSEALCSFQLYYFPLYAALSQAFVPSENEREKFG